MAQMIPKVFLIHGNQQLLVDETVESVTDKMLDGRDREWSLERFNAEEILKKGNETSSSKLDDFIISCETLPMLTDRKIIRLDHFELIKKAAKKNDVSPASRLFQIIQAYISEIPDSLRFIFTSPVLKDTEFSKPLLRKIKENGRIQKFVSYDDYSPVIWLVQRGKLKKLPITNEVAKLFIDVVGNDLCDLDQELEKLSLLLEGSTVTEDAIREHIRGHKHFSVFKMTENLSRKELLPALEILNQQLETAPSSKGEHVRLFSLIVMQFRRMLLIHSMIGQKMTDTSILGKISLPPFLGKQAISQAKYFRKEELLNIHEELADLDLRVKFQGALAPLLLQDLFQKICSSYFLQRKS